MLGYVFMFFIGREFYLLAREFKKVKLVFALIGAVSYYVGSVIGTYLAFHLVNLMSGSVLEPMSLLFGVVLAFAVGFATSWWFYSYLKKYWSNEEKRKADAEILDDGLYE